MKKFVALGLAAAGVFWAFGKSKKAPADRHLGGRYGAGLNKVSTTTGPWRNW